MFDIDAVKVIHKTENEDVYLANTGDAIANLRSIGRQTQEKINEYNQRLQANRKERLRLEEMDRLDGKPQNEEPKTDIISMTSNFDKVVEEEKQQSLERERKRREMYNRFNKEREERTKIIPDDIKKEEIFDRDIPKDAENIPKEPKNIPVRHRMSKEDRPRRDEEIKEMQTFSFSEEDLKEMAENKTDELVVVKDEPENEIQESEADFLAELKSKTKVIEQDVKRIEDIEERKPKEEIESTKVETISGEIYSRDRDEEKEKEIASLLKERQAEIEKYEKIRKMTEKSKGFAKPKKQMTSGMKWMIAIGVVILIALFCGFRANGYAYDTYGAVAREVNTLTGEVTEIKISGIGCLFSSFTVESVSMFVPVFNGKVFAEAFLLVAGIGAVAVFLIWSSNDTKKKNRDGKEHGNSRIATPADIRRYQKHFMD